MKRNRLCLLFIHFLFSFEVFAQGVFTVAGRVQDAETNEPIAYATVAIENVSFGTITNLAGEFDFHVPDVFKDRIMVISSLGYVDYKVELNKLELNNIVVLSLQPSKILLDEVLISEDLTAGDLLRIAIFKIDRNYPMFPVEMNGFYRETKTVNGDYVSLLEAAVRIFDKNYQAPKVKSNLRERVSLIEVRRTIDYDRSLKKYFKQYNMLEDLLLENLVKYRMFDQEEGFYAKLKRKKVPGYNNQPINLVYLEEDNYLLKIYIDEDYGIHRINFILGDGENPLFIEKKSGRLNCNVMFMKKQIEFQKQGDKLYLKYIASKHQNEWINRKTEELQLITERNQALLINQINTTNPRWVKNSKKMKRFGLQYQHKAYNKNFWDNYNVIKEMPLDEKIRKDLEKKISLDEQFKFYE